MIEPFESEIGNGSDDKVCFILFIFRFIQFYLTHRRNELLQRKNWKSPLQFKDIVTFENAPFLHDEAWNPPEEKKKKRRKKKVLDVAVEDEQTEQDRLFDL